MPVLTPASPDEIEKILTLHKEICDIAVSLSMIDQNDYDVPQEQKDKFVSDRFWYLIYKERVEMHVITVLVSRLIALEKEIKSGIKQLKQELKEMEDFIAVLNLVEKVMLLVGQVVIAGRPF
jgi:hypothetical protein